MIPTPPPAPAIFRQAQKTWEARRLPQYVSFDVQIVHRDAAGAVTTGSEHVLLRTFDHWCRTREVESGSAQVKTSEGFHCVGPAFSPLGFNIASQYPNSAQVDPFASPLHTIATVQAAHYTVVSAGTEGIDGHPCYKLALTPISDPDYYPLRAVWVDEATGDVRKLTYAMHQNGWSAAIDYTFMPYPPGATWWISTIQANWTPPPRDTNREDLAFRSTLQLTNVTFSAAP